MRGTSPELEGRAEQKKAHGTEFKRPAGILFFCPKPLFRPPQQWQLHWRQGAHPGRGHAPPGTHGSGHPQGGGRAPARRHGAISPAKITKIRTRIRILRIGSERKLRRASVRAGEKRPGGATGAGEYQQAGHRNMGQKILPGHVLTPHPPPARGGNRHRQWGRLPIRTLNQNLSIFGQQHSHINQPITHCQGKYFKQIRTCAAAGYTAVAKSGA